jgi:hypothetical protein
VRKEIEIESDVIPYKTEDEDEEEVVSDEKKGEKKKHILDGVEKRDRGIYVNAH